ncbi:hypothetical protein PT276_08000 [Orbaceae bacterium ESL0721]|nr:hypothetical protein [Orbaceae bacterium ESL0721]
MEQTTIDPRYSKAQVCNYIGDIDNTTLDKWVASGKFPPPDLYLGRHPRWKLSTINAYLNAKEQEYKLQLCG